MRFQLFSLFFLNIIFIQAQVYTFQTNQNGKRVTHRILMDQSYLVETQFVSDPPEFILTRGGFYSKEGEAFIVNFEFNSNFEKDGIKQLVMNRSKDWTKTSKKTMDLNGKWLMAGRMTDQGQQRRDISRPRKTMKFLLDGYFQWIAFNTETLDFFGSGGGYYTTENGKYTEHIEYFSRDNSRVGAVLPFEYSLKGSDWHHQGFSSKGDPMHEIWSLRIQ
ncbi:hypothetical protein N9V25_03205 [Flavobacteriaceae bacterium]|jgi:hypothetical protein|nr:hypothetical protein [Flavobacteriaceae bacterium]MDB2328047.1 hypothetical protein [Flavobacteriaceae bacterium]